MPGVRICGNCRGAPPPDGITNTFAAPFRGEAPNASVVVGIELVGQDLSLAENGRIVYEARGALEGRIASEPRGNGGFGYDPIFFYPPLGCTLAEAADRKSAVSHRGAAFRVLREHLEARRRLSEERERRVLVDRRGMTP